MGDDLRAIDRQLPVHPDCDECPARHQCLAAFSDTRCWDSSFYPEQYDHPDRGTGTEPDLIMRDPPRWARVPTEKRALPILGRHASKEFPEFVAPISALMSELKGGSNIDAPEPVAFLGMGHDQKLSQLLQLQPRLASGVGPPVIGPIFSTWDDAPPFQHHTATAWTLHMERLVAHHGAAVPGVPLSRHVDMRHHRRLLVEGDARDVAVDLALNSERNWKAAVANLCALHAAVEDLNLRLIAHGPFALQRLREVVEIWGSNVVFVSKGPEIYANRGHAVTPTLEKHLEMTYSKQELLPMNVAAFEEAVASLLESSGSML